jgi:hypothetical protein
MINIFQFFERHQKATHKPVDLRPDTVNSMSLAQRKAYREEMLYHAIREAFLSMELISSMYKFKVIPVDVRHHRFIAMVDVAKSFVSGSGAKTKSFADLEKRLRIYAYGRLGILVTGVYWRVSEAIEEFECQPRSADLSDSYAKTLMETRRNPSDSIEIGSHTDLRLGRSVFQAVSAEEANAFSEALRQGVTPPGIHVGNLEYKSDLMPLDEGIMIGGTQYGRL